MPMAHLKAAQQQFSVMLGLEPASISKRHCQHYDTSPSWETWAQQGMWPWVLYLVASNMQVCSFLTKMNWFLDLSLKLKVCVDCSKPISTLLSWKEKKKYFAEYLWPQKLIIKILMMKISLIFVLMLFYSFISNTTYSSSWIRKRLGCFFMYNTRCLAISLSFEL